MARQEQSATKSSAVPSLRVRICNRALVRAKGKFVLYWVIAQRRLQWNFALDRALEWATELGKPLVVLEALRSDYRWTSDRLHRFVLDGMAENARRAGSSVLYYPYVEPKPGAGRGLLASLAQDCCLVVTDEYPCSFLPRMVEAAARRLRVRLEAVDSNGLLPLRAADRVFKTAHSFRRFIQMNLLAHLESLPKAKPLKGLRLPRLKALPRTIVSRWPPAPVCLLAGEKTELERLPIDHSVPVAPLCGGSRAGENMLRRFLRDRLPRYVEDHNRVDREATSGLSPYLHFGHVSAHQVFHELMRREQWRPSRPAGRASGSRTGWWGVSADAEAFMDQLITWRELGFNSCALRRDYDRYGSLPAWARETLAEHSGDPRPYLYTLKQFEAAVTHDEVWNAAQRQLLIEGRMHNYLRMYWGKKVLEWTRSPREALRVLIELNNKYALDGRDPNSYSGILWCLGRYDRPWGPERPIFGTVRYMSQAGTIRKTGLRR